MRLSFVNYGAVFCSHKGILTLIAARCEHRFQSGSWLSLNERIRAMLIKTKKSKCTSAMRIFSGSQTRVLDGRLIGPLP